MGVPPSFGMETSRELDQIVPTYCTWMRRPGVASVGAGLVPAHMQNRQTWSALLCPHYVHGRLSIANLFKRDKGHGYFAQPPANRKRGQTRINLPPYPNPSRAQENQAGACLKSLA